MFLFSPTKETKIYLSSRIIEQANETVNEKLEIANTHDLDAQLRQVRSRLTSPRTYTRSRFSSQWTNRTSCQPYSIFTLLDRDFADSKNDSVIASSLLVCIADCMRFEKGLLKRSRLLEIALEQKMTSTSKLHQSILSMFNDDNIMNTIGNAQLEGLLVELAEICTHYLKAVNEGIKTNIINCLKELE
ncbi:hypothetical protein MFLAVUS_009950 [Mucor flavus]|uniref:Uncharacterized protein n=1 Tax=Mucor flavus TaxID=439312 RepID=A0ABP9ZBG3_9FUNG